MHIYRFNPVFNQWVLLGNPVPQALMVEKVQLLDIGKQKGFAAAVNPHQPFILEPGKKVHSNLLHAEEQPVGEYEFLLSNTKESFFDWGASEWEGWTELLQLRLMEVHRNPYLHFVQLTLHTSLLHTVGEEYERVGDLIATSHPIAGEHIVLTKSLLKKLREHEKGYFVHNPGAGDLYIPSAPFHDKEVWYVPKEARNGFEKMDKTDRVGFAKTMSVLLPALREEYDSEEFVLVIHTAIAGRDETTWWAQIYQSPARVPATLDVRAMPEPFARHLNYLLTSRKR